VISKRSSTILRVGLALAIMMLLGIVAGCSQPQSTAPTSTPPAPKNLTAKQAYALALSKATSDVPDAKLLLAQTGGPVTATSTITWQFLVGSPKTDKVWVITVDGSKVTTPAVYGKAGLSPAEWKLVPSADAWKVDSTEGHDKAIAVYTNGKNAAYFMGFVTYVPKAAKNLGAPMKWVVSFDPASKGSAPTSTVNVDLTTGQAAYVK
jgi:hypothetical protein